MMANPRVVDINYESYRGNYSIDLVVTISRIRIVQYVYIYVRVYTYVYTRREYTFIYLSSV